MALSYRARRRWSLVILLVGMPAYVVAVITVLNWLDRPPIWLELLVYVLLGVLWALPFRFVFRGIGRPDPETPQGAAPDAQSAAGRGGPGAPDAGPSAGDGSER